MVSKNAFAQITFSHHFRSNMSVGVEMLAQYRYFMCSRVALGTVKSYHKRISSTHTMPDLHFSKGSADCPLLPSRKNFHNIVSEINQGLTALSLRRPGQVPPPTPPPVNPGLHTHAQSFTYECHTHSTIEFVLISLPFCPSDVTLRDVNFVRFNRSEKNQGTCNQLNSVAVEKLK